MRTLDPLIQQAINEQEIWPVYLIELGTATPYYITDHYTTIEFGDNTYVGNGSLLSIDSISDSTTANHDSMEISLSAIDSVFRTNVLAENVIGSSVKVYRGLIEPTVNAVNFGTVIADPFLIYEGIVYSTSASEDNPVMLSAGLEFAGFTATIEVRSSTFRLDETPGRFTNDESQKRVDSTDRSMEFVAGLNGRNVRFGGSA